MNKEVQKQHIVDIMKSDEELGLYDEKKEVFKKFSNIKCNHSFKMDEVWDINKDPKCSKCGKLLSELTPKVQKKK